MRKRKYRTEILIFEKHLKNKTNTSLMNPKAIFAHVSEGLRNQTKENYVNSRVRH
jgi:hypothetical protein